MQIKKGLNPATDLGRGRPGSGEGGMLILLHDLLLSREVSERSIHLYRVSHLKGKVHEAFFICKGDYGSVSKCDCSARADSLENSLHPNALRAFLASL